MSFIIGANVIVVRDNMLLLGLRKNFGNNTWGLPGGHVEWQESCEKAAGRELLEETGILVSGLTFLSMVDQPDHDAHYMQGTFLAENPAGDPVLLEPHECYEWSWFPLHDLPENIFYPHATPIRLFLENTQAFATDNRL
jgi:8-oxo-dGTP diphosphatase